MTPRKRIQSVRRKKFFVKTTQKFRIVTGDIPLGVRNQLNNVINVYGWLVVGMRAWLAANDTRPRTQQLDAVVARAMAQCFTHRTKFVRTTLRENRWWSQVQVGRNKIPSAFRRLVLPHYLSGGDFRPPPDYSVPRKNPPYDPGGKSFRWNASRVWEPARSDKPTSWWVVVLKNRRLYYYLV